MFKSALRVEVVYGRGGKFKLTSPLVYEGSEAITVPTGFVTDLTTFYPEGRYTPCSVIHDYCITELKDWSLANKLMREAMDDPQLEIRYLTKQIIYIGICVGRLIAAIERVLGFDS